MKKIKYWIIGFIATITAILYFYSSAVSADDVVEPYFSYIVWNDGDSYDYVKYFHSATQFGLLLIRYPDGDFGVSYISGVEGDTNIIETAGICYENYKDIRLANDCPTCCNNAIYTFYAPVSYDTESFNINKISKSSKIYGNVPIYEVAYEDFKNADVVKIKEVYCTSDGNVVPTITDTYTLENPTLMTAKVRNLTGKDGNGLEHNGIYIATYMRAEDNKEYNLHLEYDITFNMNMFLPLTGTTALKHPLYDRQRAKDVNFTFSENFTNVVVANAELYDTDINKFVFLSTTIDTKDKVKEYIHNSIKNNPLETFDTAWICSDCATSNQSLIKTLKKNNPQHIGDLKGLTIRGYFYTDDGQRSDWFTIRTTIDDEGRTAETTSYQQDTKAEVTDDMDLNDRALFELTNKDGSNTPIVDSGNVNLDDYVESDKLDGDFNSNLDSLVKMMKNVPHLFAELFSFLPSYVLYIIGFVIVVCVACRVIGR